MDPILQYHGAKNYMVQEVLRMMPKHEIYVEPFAGSASVLFHKKPVGQEIINDLNSELVNFFKVLKKYPDELAFVIKHAPFCRTSIESLMQGNDIHRAASFCLRYKINFSGIPKEKVSPAFQYKDNSKLVVLANWHERVAPASRRLQKVKIWRKDALEVISKFKDNPDALIYCDPPYRGHEHEYLYRVDMDRLLGVIKDAKAKIILSAGFEESSYLKGWYMNTVEIRRKCHKKEDKEYLFCNFLGTGKKL